MSMRIGLALAAALALAACGPKVDGPDAVVKALYAPYIQGPASAIAPFGARDVFTPELNAEIARGETYGNLLDEPVIDYDPILGGQDGAVKDLTVATQKSDRDTASVTVSFDNMGTARHLTYALSLIGGAWRIDDIFEGEEGLRAIIAAAIAPAGDAAAMEAPVRAIYARYASDTRVEPLHRWAALTDDLRRRMAIAANVHRQTQLPMNPTMDPAMNTVLEFDPVIDARRADLGPVSYEAASSAIIARFDNAGEPKIVVYDLTEDNGAWKVADIRAPGHWVLTQRLREAGVQ